MKCFCLMLLLLAFGGWTGTAQADETQTLTIHSDLGRFDMTNYRTIYLGHVRADDPRMHLTSDWLAADLPHDKNSDTHVVAATNVVMLLLDDKGQTNHASSDQAVYHMHVESGVTNETVTLTGHAKMWNDKISVIGEPLVYDMVQQELAGSNYVTSFTHDALNSLGGTNSASHKTNSVPRIPGL